MGPGTLPDQSGCRLRGLGIKLFADDLVKVFHLRVLIFPPLGIMDLIFQPGYRLFKRFHAVQRIEDLIIALTIS